MQQLWGRGPRGGRRAAGRDLVRGAVLAALIGSGSFCSAQVMYWDPKGLNSPGGSGVWDATSLEWSPNSWGGNDTAWPNTADSFYWAEFGGPGGTVTLDSSSTSLYTYGLTFDSAYTINGPATGTAGLVLNKGPSIYISYGVNATVNANLSGLDGFTAKGPGTLTLGGNNGGVYGAINLSSNVNLTASTAGSANAAWTLNGVTLSYDPSVGGTGKTIQLGSLAGSGTLTNRGTAGPSDVTTFAIGALSASTTFSGSITDSAAGDRTALALTSGSRPTDRVPTLTLTGSSTYSGPTSVTGSALQLEGTAGGIAGSSDITVAAGSILDNGLSGGFIGSLLIDNSVSGNNNNRIPDTAAIHFYNGALTYTGSSSTSSSETVGAITLNGGYNTITIGPNGYGATVNAASLTRPAFGGTAFVNGYGLALAAAPSLVGSGAITDGHTPTEHNAPIVPFLVGNFTGGSQPLTFITYDKSGALRPLSTADEYTTNAVVAGDNILISANTSAASSATVNALNVQQGTLTIGSGAALNVASGAVLLNAYNNVTISGSNPASSTLTFNNGEAIIRTIGGPVPYADPEIVTISANLSGLTGLTLFGYFGTLSLAQNASTTDSAPIYIQSGGVAVSQDFNLGYATGPNAITFPVGSTGWLQFTGNTFSTSTKGISLLGQGGLSVVQANESAWVGSVISGPGRLIKSGKGTLTLANPTNTYTGATVISGGTLALAANSNNNVRNSALILVADSFGWGPAVLDATQLTAPGGFKLAAGQMLAGTGTVKPPSGGLVVGPGSTISGGDGVAVTGNLSTAGAQVWNGGGTYQWKINLNSVWNHGTLDTTKSGKPWDQLTMNSLVVSATPANPFNIQIVGITGQNPTNNFDPTKSYSWVAANMPVGQATGNLANTLAVTYAGFSSYNIPGHFNAAFDSVDDPGFTDLVISYSPTPEPSALLLAGASAGCLLLKRRRTQRPRG